MHEYKALLSRHTLDQSSEQLLHRTTIHIDHTRLLEYHRTIHTCGPKMQLSTDAAMTSDWIDLDSFISIVIVNTGTKFNVHKHVGCEKSPFVASAMKEHTREAQAQQIEIHEWDDDDAMRTLVKWMYQGKTVLRIQFPDDTNEIDSPQIINLQEPL